MDGKGTFFEACLLPSHKGGTLSISNHQVTARNCSEVTLMLYAATSYNGPRKSPSKEGKNPHQEIMSFRKISEGENYQELKKKHIIDYQSLFNRVSFILPAKKLQKELPTDERIKEIQGRRRSGINRTVISVRTLFNDSRFPRRRTTLESARLME